MEGGKGAWGWREERGRVYMCTLHVVILLDNLKFASYEPAPVLYY